MNANWKDFVDAPLAKRAWSLFREKTPEEKAREAQIAARERKAKILGKMKDLYDPVWGGGKHDDPRADDRSILPETTNPDLKKGTFSSDTQFLPDECLKYLAGDSGLGSWLVGKFTGAGDIASTAKDPKKDIRFFLDNAPSLPSNWNELSATMSKKIPKVAPANYVAAATNAMHYAFNPVLTGKVDYKNLSDAGKTEFVSQAAKRLNEGMRHHLEKPKANEVASARL